MRKLVWPAILIAMIATACSTVAAAATVTPECVKPVA